jgi:hypothetical protein
VHLPAEWALAFLTHCPKHLQHLKIGCPNCNAIGRFGFTAASSALLCAGCGQPIPLRSYPSGLQEDFPCPFLVGAISAAHFLLTMKDVLHLLTHRENGEGPILANSVGSREFSYFQPLPRGIEYPPLFTLPARLRFTLMAALAQFLLGPRSTDYYEPAPNSKNQFYPFVR